jgi:hypothetical protein
MAALGVRDLISMLSPFLPLLLVLIDDAAVTNAAGSLKADVPVGTSAFVPHTHIYPYRLPYNLTPQILPLLLLRCPHQSSSSTIT